MMTVDPLAAAVIFIGAVGVSALLIWLYIRNWR